MTVPIAAATAAVVGIPQAAGHLTFGILAAAAGLAILLPVLPFALEMLALRRMTPTAFGTLMALEPALGRAPRTARAAPAAFGHPGRLGILLVVLAGAGAQRGGRRDAPDAAPQRADLAMPVTKLEPT